MREKQSKRLLISVYDYIEKSIILQSIKNGLVMLIPNTIYRFVFSYFDITAGRCISEVYQQLFGWDFKQYIYVC